MISLAIHGASSGQPMCSQCCRRRQGEKKSLQLVTEELRVMDTQSSAMKRSHIVDKHRRILKRSSATSGAQMSSGTRLQRNLADQRPSETVPEVRFEFKNISGASCGKAHCRLGHPPTQKFIRMLRLGTAAKVAVHHVHVHWCAICVASTMPD